MNDRGSVASCRFVLRWFIVCSLVGSNPPDARTADESLLPFAGTDHIVLLDRTTGRLVSRSGSIEDIEQDFVLFRFGGAGRVKAIPLVDVEELRFDQNEAHSRALEQFEASRFEAALQSCEQARTAEARAWVRDEIQALAVRCCLYLNRRTEALRRIEEICEHDPKSRHCGLLPLVWDLRTRPDERYPASPDELVSPSLPGRLAAASALLHEPAHRTESVRVLQELRVARAGPVSVLAEIQLWRLALLGSEDITPDLLVRRQRRAADLPPWLSGGAHYVIGRGLEQQHDTDQAASEFLWTPLMSSDDPVLSAWCLTAAEQCLRETARIDSADRIRAELYRRFPQTSAATLLHSQPVSGSVPAATDHSAVVP